MEKFMFFLWEDAKIATNKVHGVVEIDESDLGRLVAEKYTAITGKKVVHWELRGVVSDPEEAYPNMLRLDIGQEE